MTTTHETGMADQAKQTADTAKDEAQNLASVAQHEAKHVATEARDQARGLVDQATTQVEEQSREQARRLAGTVRTFGDDMQSMADGAQGGIAADLARQVADRARSLSSQLENREPRELLDDVKNFARRRPGTFLLGALAAGVVAGRVARGAKEAQSSSGTSPAPTSTGGASSPGIAATGGAAAGTGNAGYGGYTGDTGDTEGRLRGTGLTDDDVRPSSGAVPTGLDETPGTSTGDPLAGTSRPDPLSAPDSPDSAYPTGPSSPGGRG